MDEMVLQNRGCRGQLSGCRVKVVNKSLSGDRVQLSEGRLSVGLNEI